MKRTNQTKKLRNNGGSVLVLAILFLTFIFVPVAINLFKCSLLMTMRTRYQNHMEATALLVADRLSKIVINDSHFGYISLNNQPPIGKATLAGDGEPCPVSSINNLLGTLRLDTLIANERNDSNLVRLVNDDYQQAQYTTVLLQSALTSSIDSENLERFYDMNGNAVTAYDDAKAMLAKSLQYDDCGNPVKISNFRISLGWLRQGGTTNTPVPNPLDMAQLPPDSEQNGMYKSCIDVPAFGNSFYFAPVSKSAALVDGSMFCQPDGKRFSSVVKVEADLSYDNKLIHIAACAIPGERPQTGPAGALLLQFPCGLRELRNLDDLLRLAGGEITQSYRAVNGDLPVNPEASTIDASIAPWSAQEITSSRVVASGLYCWLRQAGIRPRIDSTVLALRLEFRRFLENSNLLYEFDSGGNIVISSLPAMPLPVNVVSEQQIFTQTSCENYTINCYNNVYNLGTINGGRHAGQLMSGDPINWCDLPYFGLSAESACKQSKGYASGLTVSNDRTADTEIPGAVLKDLAQFETHGKPVTLKPRKSYYSGGLAVELSISEI